MTTTLPPERKPAPVDQLYLDARGMAKMLGISPRSVWRLRDAGQLPAPVRLGKSVRWSKAAVLEHLERQQQTPSR